MSNQLYANFETRRKYDVNTSQITTSPGGEFTTINNDLILNPDFDVLNTEVLTIDNFGLVNKTSKENLFVNSNVTINNLTVETDTILNNVQQDDTEDKLLVLDSITNKVEYRDVSSLPPVPPYNQQLNSFNSPVEFGNITPTTHEPTDATIQLTKVSNGTQLATYQALKEYPEISLASNALGQYFMWGCYLDASGQIMASGDAIGGPRRGAYFVQTNDSFFMHALIGSSGQNPTNDIIMMEWREGTLGFATLKLQTRVITANLRVDSGLQTHTVSLLNSNDELIKTPRESLFGQDLTSTSNVQHNEMVLDGILTLNNTPSNNSNNKFLTLDEITNVVELGDLEIVQLNVVGGATGLSIVSQDTGPFLSVKGFLEGDLNIKLVSSATDLSVSLETIVTVAPQMGQVVGTNDTNQLFKMDTETLFSQQLLPTSSVGFSSVTTTTSTTNTLNLLGIQAQDNNVYNVLVQSGTGEVKINDMTPKYDYSFYENNSNPTLTNTINTWTQVPYSNTVPNQFGDGLFTILDVGGFLVYRYNEIDNIIDLSFDFNIYKQAGGNDLYQFQIRLNGSVVGPSPFQKLEDITKWQMLSVHGITPLETNDDITFWARCVNNTDSLFVGGLTVTANIL